MGTALIIFYLAISVFDIGTSCDTLPNNEPLLIENGYSLEEIEYSAPAFRFSGRDSSLEFDMFLLSDSHQMPVCFYSDITTPVCIDNICKPVSIEMYWSLTGDYIGFGIYENKKLTKFDHDLFEASDYEKLHSLLINKHSILDRRSLTDLYDVQSERKKQIQFQGQEIDAISGATKKEIKKYIIQGALYSCYSLWYLANKQSSEKVRTYTQDSLLDNFSDFFLNSNIPDYQLLALKSLNDKELEKHTSRLLELIDNSTPVMRSYVLKKMSKNFYNNKKYIERIYKAFERLDFNSKTLLIDKLSEAHPYAAELVSHKIEALSKNQLKGYLQHLQTLDATSEYITNQLKLVTEEGSYPYSYLIDSYLQSL